MGSVLSVPNLRVKSSCLGIEYKGFQDQPWLMLRDISCKPGLLTIFSRSHECSQNLTSFSWSLCLQYSLFSLFYFFSSGELLMFQGLAVIYSQKLPSDIHFTPRQSHSHLIPFIFLASIMVFLLNNNGKSLFLKCWCLGQELYVTLLPQADKH